MANTRMQFLCRTVCWILLLAIAKPVWAQDPPTEDSAAKQLSKEDATGDDVVAANVPANVAPSGPIDSQIHPAGKAAPWLGTGSPLQWGPFSIGNFTYQYVHDDFVPIGSLPAEDVTLSILRTSLVFDQYFFQKQRVVLQWEPQLAVLNGRFAGNSGFDNTLALGTTFQTSPRLTLTVKDAFADVHSRQLYPPGFLFADEQTGNVIQNNFLQNAGSYLSNEVGATITYLLSPKTTLAISPDYKYIRASNSQQVFYLANGHVITNTIAITRALTEHQSIGGLYSFQLLRQNDGAGVPGNSYFHTAAFFYANQFAKTWWIRGQFGVNLARYPLQIPPTNSFAGTISLVKTFASATFSLGYTRGLTQNTFLTNHIGDLVQAAYIQHLTRRLAWNTGLGYYRETGADPRNMGNTAGTGLELEVRPNLFLEASYNHLFQKSNTPQLLSGTRNTVVASLKWEPRAPIAH